MSRVLNVAAYRFVPVADPEALCDRLRARAEALDLKGTVLVASEGINLFLAGLADDLRAFLDDLQADARFSGLTLKFSESAEVPFGRLKVRVRSEIITFRKFDLEPGKERAPVVSPQMLEQWLGQGHDAGGRPVVMVDTRNDAEVSHGTFVGAVTLPIVRFTELPDALEAHRAALAGKTIVTFCTGGIRCEKAALWMQNAGYENVVQLDGGILGYFEQVGGAHYQGDCFVFDARRAVDPALRATAP